MKFQTTKIKITIILIVSITICCLFGIKPVCIFNYITGMYCPGCGITRMFESIIKLDFYQAFRYNPLVFILLPILIPYVTYLIYIWLTNKKDKITSKIPKKVIYLLLIIVITYGILRNTELFSCLKPTIIN